MTIEEHEEALTEAIQTITAIARDNSTTILERNEALSLLSEKEERLFDLNMERKLEELWKTNRFESCRDMVEIVEAIGFFAISEAIRQQNKQQGNNFKGDLQ